MFNRAVIYEKADRSRTYFIIDEDVLPSFHVLGYFTLSLHTIILPDFLSNKQNGNYEVKITSATNNPNIIFELSLKDNVDFDMFTIQCLIEFINDNK